MGVTVPFVFGLEDPPAPASEGPVVDTLVAELDGGAGGLAVDRTGTLYCADFGSKLGRGGEGGDKVYRIDPESGEATVFARGLRGASGNAWAPDGVLYQSSIGGGTISRVRPSGKVETFVSRGLQSPVGIAIDEAGLLFAANCGSGSIVEIDSAGEAVEFARSPLLSCPNGLALDDDHILYVSNFNNGDVLSVSPSGEVARLATLPGNNNGHLTFHQGALYVVARSAHQIYRVGLDGETKLFAGTGERGRRDGPALEATFSFPNDLAFSPDGKVLYVNENASTTEPASVLAPMRVRRIRIEP